jgi:serine/threonine protein kinase
MRPGDALGEYQLLSLIGAGGMGEVWAAHQQTLGRRVALKLLPEDLTRDTLRISRFEQEARAASALSHPNVAHIYALGQTADGRRYIAMELVEGQTLRARLRNGHLPLAEAIRFAVQVAAALAAAHAAGVIHRDIKPENVMIRPDGFIKVLDFGLAKLVPTRHELAAAETTHTLLHTDPGSAVGTVTYMSPEQARGQDVDHRTDIWSLGVVLYEMVAGRSPFAGPSSSDVLAAILDRDPDPLSRVDPRLPAEMQRIVAKALRKNREQRYQTIRDLQLDLESLATDVASQTHRATTPSDPITSEPPAISSVTQGTLHQSSAEYLVTQVARHKVRSAAIVLATIAIAAPLIWWNRSHQTRPNVRAREPLVTRLLASQPDRPIQGWQISPDGRYLAATDPAGIQLVQIDTGDVERLPDTAGLAAYGWSADSSKLHAASCVNGTCTGWALSLIGKGRVQSDGTWPFADGWTFDPRVGILSHQGSGLLIYPSDGSPSLTLNIDASQWATTADSAAILYVPRTHDNELKRVPLRGGATTNVWTAPADWIIWSVASLARSRVALLIMRRPPKQAIALFDLSVDASGVAVGEPRRLTDWRIEVDNAGIAASADGQRVAWCRQFADVTSYIGQFDPRTRTLGAPRPLTPPGTGGVMEIVTDWTADSKTVVYNSNRNGNFDLFKQEVDRDVLDPLVIAPGEQLVPRITADQRWVLYMDASDAGLRLLRVPLAGGLGQLLGTIPDDAVPACAPRGRCVLVVPTQNVVYELDPLHGVGAELASLPANTESFCLLPDGQRFAHVVRNNGALNTIRVVTLKDHQATDILVEQAEKLGSIVASDDGFFVVNQGIDLYHPGNSAVIRTSELLFIDHDGSVTKLWSSPNMGMLWAFPSPDGKKLAIPANTMRNEIWMISDLEETTTR